MDKKFRELERLAAQGDHQALVALTIEKARLGLIEPISCELEAVPLYFGVSDYFSGFSARPGIDFVCYTYMGVTTTWGELIDGWISDFNERSHGDTYLWYNENPEYEILHKVDPKNPAWMAPLARFTNEEIRKAFIEILHPHLRKNYYELVCESSPHAADLAQPDCGDCAGVGIVDADICECVESSDLPQAIALLRAVCED